MLTKKPQKIQKTFYIILILVLTLSLSSLFTINKNKSNLKVQAINEYTTSQNKIYKNGTEIQLFGVNWFGAEVDSTLVPHGLWTRDYKDMIAQVKDLNFNAFRIPFCPATLKNTTNRGGVNTSNDRNADIANLKPLETLKKITDEMSSQGMYFILDHHRPDCQVISEKWYTINYSEENWLDDLKFVATEFSNNPNFVGLDLKNEPHTSVDWGSGNVTKDWRLAAEKAGKAVNQVNSRILIFVEGTTGGNPTCSDNSLNYYWGENFQPIECFPIRSESIPANKLVLSPHVYGPDVSIQAEFNDSNFPNNLSAWWQTKFGFAVDSGYTIAIGEFGGQYGRKETKERAVFDKLTEFMKTKRLCNWFYWSWNPNSGDTGGILGDGGQDDWINIRKDKMTVLNSLMNSCNSNIPIRDFNNYKWTEFIGHPNSQTSSINTTFFALNTISLTSRSPSFINNSNNCLI